MPSPSSMSPPISFSGTKLSYSANPPSVTAPSFTMARCRRSCRPHEPCYLEGCPDADLTPAHQRPAPPRRRPNDEVLIGVGNKAGRDFDMDVSENDVIGGQGRVRVGVGNRARRDNRGRVLHNSVEDADGDVAIGVGNSAGRDSEMDVVDNVVSGGDYVRVGVGNRAGRDNRCVVAGNRIFR